MAVAVSWSLFVADSGIFVVVVAAAFFFAVFTLLNSGNMHYYCLPRFHGLLIPRVHEKMKTANEKYFLVRSCIFLLFFFFVLQRIHNIQYFATLLTNRLYFPLFYFAFSI